MLASLASECYRFAPVGELAEAKKSMNPVTRLRKIALMEGVSFLVLLLIAMPLKYLADLPVAVKIVGSIHGLLFVIFGMALLQVMVKCRWPLGRAMLVFIAALLPLGPFLLDRRMVGYEREATPDPRQ